MRARHLRDVAYWRIEREGDGFRIEFYGPLMPGNARNVFTVHLRVESLVLIARDARRAVKDRLKFLSELLTRE